MLSFKRLQNLWQTAGTARRKLSEGIELDVKELEGLAFGDFMVFHSNEFNAINGVAIACATKSPVGADIIVVDDLFMELSDVAKTFVILHEEGHLIDEQADFNKGVRVRDYREEFFADNHAVKTLGVEKTLIGMKEVYSLLSQFRIFKDKEFVLRMNKIKEMEVVV